MKIDRIDYLKKIGAIYYSYMFGRNDLKKNLGAMWFLYLLRKILFFHGYSFKNKMDLILGGKDEKRLFWKYFYKSRYELIDNFYSVNQSQIKFSMVKNFTSEQLRSYFNNAREVIFCNLYNIDSILSPSDTILDIGASIGLFTIYVKELYPKSRIICFEPEKGNFSCLKSNVKDYKNVSIYNLAVGDRSAIKKLKKSTNNLIHSIVDGSNLKLQRDYYGFQMTKIISIDEIIKEKVDVMKIDDEGYEKKVIEGSVKTLKKFSPILLFDSLGQKKDIIDKMNSLDKRYHFIELNEDTICFYIQKKHKSRIDKFKKCQKKKPLFEK